MSGDAAKTEEALRTEGSAAYKDGRYKDAIELYRQAVAADETSHKARHNIALCHMQLREWPAALEAVNRALAKDSAEGKYHMTRGRVLVEMKRFDEARAAFDVAKSGGKDVDADLAAMARRILAMPAPSSSSSSSSSSSASAAPARAPAVPPRRPGADADERRLVMGPDGFPIVKAPVPEAPIVEGGALPGLPGYVQAAARAVMLVAGAGYWLPLGAAPAALAFRAFFGAALCAEGARFLATNGAPPNPLRDRAGAWAWPQLSGLRMSAAADAPAIGAALTCLMARPHALLAIGFVPVGATHLMYALEWLCDEARGPVARASPRAAAALADGARRATDLLVQGLPGGGALRRKALLLALVKAQAAAEVALLVALVALLAFPAHRSVVAIFLLGQCLYLRLLFSPYSRAVFEAADRVVKDRVLAMPMCPEVVRKTYEWLRATAVQRLTKTFTEAAERAQAGR
jgi:DnaJ family protein C protein 7